MATPTAGLLTTALHDHHRALGAKLVDFAGWEMPISYAGTVGEHAAVRRAAGLFDIGHMGRIDVRGPGAGDWIQQLVTSNTETLKPGAARYALVCNERGTILDDIFVYKRDTDNWLLIVNGANRLKIAAWIERHRPKGITAVDRTLETGLIALQGPRAAAILERLIGSPQTGSQLHTFTETTWRNRPLLVARTGYTGEWGVELMADQAAMRSVWEGVLEAGRSEGLVPVGLGARDTLRLEMGYMLYGNDIDETTTPLEAGLGWVVDFNKPDFIGKNALTAQKQAGVGRKLVGFELLEKGVPRHGHPIQVDGKPVGVVTSGNLSPTLDRGIGLGYVESNYAALGTTLAIDIRGKIKPATVVKPPFYRRKV
jgi:aminomethyltransferase